MGYETGTPDIASRIGDRERNDSETLLACSDQAISGSPAQAARAQPRANGAGAHRCLPPAAARVSPQEPGGGGGTAQSSPRLRPAPPPSRTAVPPPPRRARLRRSSRLCNVSSRSGGGDESGSGPGPAVAASAARPGTRTARHRGHLAASGAPRAALRSAVLLLDTGPAGLRPRTKDHGHRASGNCALGPTRESSGSASPRLPFLGGRSPRRSGPVI